MAAKSWDTPPSLWMNGGLVPWNECRVHVTSGYAQRGASIFEGIRIYKHSRPGAYVAVGLAQHLQRLESTWRALSLPVSHSVDSIRRGIVELLSVRELGDCYCRVTRYLDMRTSDGVHEADGAFVALFERAPLLGQPVSCIVSSWRRNEMAMPAQIKMGGHYFMLSILRQQAARSGASDAILLNDKGAICETTGAAIFLFSNGQLISPPISDGALPSVTARLVTSLAAQLGIQTSVRSVHFTELFQSSGAFLAGSLDELRPISTIDGVRISNVLESEPVAEIFRSYGSVCRGETLPEWGEILNVI